MHRHHFDASPRASQICGGRFTLTGRSVGKGGKRRYGTDDWTLLYTFGGAGCYESPRREHPALLLEPQLLVLIPPETPLQTSARKLPWDHLWAHFIPRSHWLDLMQWTRHPLGVYTLDLSNGPLREEIIFQLERAVAFTMATGADRELFALNALELVLLLCQRAGPSNKIIESDQPTRLCLEYIAANLKNKIKLSELAKVSGQSVSRLTQKFRQKTGLSPMQFLEQQRVERAMDLMARTDLKIQSIGEEVGFECPFYFSLRFRKHTGFNPRAFRIHAKAAKTILRRPNLHLNPADLQMLRQSGGS